MFLVDLAQQDRHIQPVKLLDFCKPVRQINVVIMIIQQINL